MKQSTKHFTLENFQSLIVDQFEKCNDFEIVILKGHILLEYTINHYIENVNENDVEFEPGKFTFAQKIHLFEFLSGCNREILEIINLLNKVRNDIAHRLEYKDQHISSLISLIRKLDSSFIPKLDNRNKVDELKIALSYMCGYIIGFKNAFVADKKMLRELNAKT
ncbi:MAG: hypothetical protein IR153_06195 [Flavobacterium sp.]|nr:hypothetical protein [Flavobacterium sp.]